MDHEFMIQTLIQYETPILYQIPNVKLTIVTFDI
jgi:hypothetical protein